MMRGINHQNIFEEPEDFCQFINIIDRMRTQYDNEGNSCGTNCIYYAYCLMSNYFHLLIRERDEKVGDTMRKLVIPSRELQVHMSIVTQIKDYKYSSWCEYDGTVEPVFQICNTQTVVNRIPFNDFRIAGVSNSSEFQKLDRGTQWQAFILLKEFGASVRQLQCLTGIDRGIIQRAR